VQHLLIRAAGVTDGGARADPSTGTAGAYGPRAAGSVPRGLPRFVLAIASYLDVTADTDSDLAAWLLQYGIQPPDAVDWVRDQVKPPWLLVDLGGEHKKPPGSAQTSAPPRHQQIRGVLYAPGRGPRRWPDTEKAQKPTRAGRPAGPEWPDRRSPRAERHAQEAVLRDLLTWVGEETHIVVDLVVPTDLLGERVEHWQIVPNGVPGSGDRLSAVFPTRVRWRRRLYEDVDRPPTARGNIWDQRPCVLTAAVQRNQAELTAWLADRSNRRYPYIVAFAADDRQKALAMLLASRRRFVIVLAAEAGSQLADKITRIADSLPEQFRRFSLPEWLFPVEADHQRGLPGWPPPADCASTPPVSREILSDDERLLTTFIWDDPEGRDGYTDFLSQLRTALPGLG
jgi:hypothetical protein